MGKSHPFILAILLLCVVTGGWPDLRAQADPGRILALFDSGLVSGASLGCVWHFCPSQLLGIAFPSSRTLGGGRVHPGNRAMVGILIPG